jgi:hypothetical protein
VVQFILFSRRTSATNTPKTAGTRDTPAGKKLFDGGGNTMLRPLE